MSNFRFLTICGLSLYFGFAIWSFSFPQTDLAGASAIGTEGNFQFYDLLNFKTAYEIACSGGNPYQVGLQNSLIDSIDGKQYEHALNFLYPPMTLVVFSSLLFLPFSSLCVLWTLLSCIAATAIGVLVSEHYLQQSKSLFVAICALVFAPALSSYYWGQFGVFLTLFLLLGLRATEQQQWWRAGFFFACCVIKPQLWFLAGLALAVWVLRERKFQLAATFATSLLTLSLAIELYLPGIHGNWWTGLQFIEGHAQASLTPTLFAIARLQLQRFGFAVGEEAVVVTTVLAVVAYAVFLLRCPNHSLGYLFSLGLLLSVLVAPYSWFQDQVVLLIALLSTTTRQESREIGELSARYLGVVFLISVSTTVLGNTLLRAQHQMFFFPVVCLGLFLAKSVEFKSSIGRRQGLARTSTRARY